MNSFDKGKCTDTGKYVEALEIEGHYGNPITLFSSTIKRKPDMKAFATFVRGNMTDGDVELLRSEMPDRLDDDQMFHLRFDKQAAYEGKVRLSSSSDAIIVKMKIETYPKDRQQAGLIVEELFG
ncbi:hypothetical protein MCMEM_0757 [Methanococcoides methylutens MM1]|uniref:Exosome subunit n=1 Tax=Methanococcoides methylutens MM1 TaxID=1434104 RepID=A0A0E3WZK4_METMT|nr:hypothetical protein MCMEM_0757 [Methanococcoides methylutens MM1]